jgi:hypothetical protein
MIESFSTIASPGVAAAMPLPHCKFGPLGSLGVDRSKLRSLPRLATFMSAELPAAPPVFNYANGITNWGMMLNDQLGCCEVATAGHLRMAWTYAATATAVAIPDSVVLSTYSALTGYDPATGQNDTGIATDDLLNYWQTTGIGGNKIAGCVAIDPTNQAEVQQAIYLFGGVFVTVNLPKSAEDQTSAGQAWSPVFWSPTLGGHAIPYLSYGPAGTKAITWGAEQDVTWEFTRQKCNGMFAIVDNDFFNAEGKSPRGLDTAGMFSAMQQLRTA